MTKPIAERLIRAGFPLARLMQNHVSLAPSNWLMRQSLRLLRLGDDLRRETVSADGVPCVWLIPDGSPVDKVLLYLHGGGFAFGLSSLHLQLGAYFAREMGTRVLFVDYRLAPQHPFPAALDDCAAAYHWLLAQGIPSRGIVVAGDSAGGNLTLTLLMKLRDAGDPLPAAAACLSPVADLSQVKVLPGYKDPLLPPRAMLRYTAAYVGDHDPRDPLISPAFGRWDGLPPLLIHAGEDEILRDDAIQVRTLARAAGVDVRLEIFPRMFHVWQLYPALPAARQSRAEIAAFLSSHLHDQHDHAGDRD